MIKIPLYNISTKKLFQLQPAFSIIQNISDKIVVAGGSILSVLNPRTEISDYDLFIISDNVNDLVKEKASIEGKLLKYGFKQTFKCPKNELSTFLYSNLKFQIINVGHKVYKTPEDILGEFDFHVCQAAYHSLDFYFSEECIRNFRGKYLSVNKITYPSSSINRLAKYRNKGYNVYNTSREIVEHISNNIRNDIPMDLNTIYVD